jgi:hypothetical protein
MPQPGRLERVGEMNIVMAMKEEEFLYNTIVLAAISETFD